MFGMQLLRYLPIGIRAGMGHNSSIEDNSLTPMDLTAQLALTLNNKVFANPRRIALLKQIANTGSLNQGAKLAGISYKAAWDAVNDMNTAMAQPVVHSEKGGKGGGGAKLTEFGERLLKVYSLTEQVQGMALAALLDDSISMNTLLDVMAHFSLNTSARNQLSGVIRHIASRGINDLIHVELACGQQVKVSITHASSEHLALAEGKPVLLLCKAPAVDLVPDTAPEACDSRNHLRGTLVEKTVLGDKTELALDIGGGDTVYSVMDAQQAESLCLQQSYQACFLASQTIIASMN
ncbi:molybdenum-dependent transcriptional regulator [Shewanella sp. NFH-SH190041]|nr:molybdenum-dependent transcriptional regulator [Shewanella sp. NFH-SH190041]